MFKSELDMDKAFTPLSIAVLAVSDTRTLETDTAGALLKSLMETDGALFERHVRVNQLGCFLGMKAVVPAMERAGGGSIVNISSTAGLLGSPHAFAYCATKWALRGMTKAAALDLAPRGIRVNSVHPGPIDTEMLKVRTEEENRARVQRVPMKRQGTAEEVAPPVSGSVVQSSAPTVCASRRAWSYPSSVLHSSWVRRVGLSAAVTEVRSTVRVSRFQA